MDGHRFDALAKGMAESGTSRRRIVTRILGASVAGVTVPRGGGEASAGVCAGEDQCDGTGSPTCGGRAGCFCYRRVGGGTVCGQSNSIDCNDRCKRDRNCPRGFVCSTGGPACCGTGKRFCVKNC